MDRSNDLSRSRYPADESYLECGLPPFLEESIHLMVQAWEKLDAGEKYLHWDCDYCNLQTDINIAEVEQIISSKQAWYLREKYLRMESLLFEDYHLAQRKPLLSDVTFTQDIL